MKIFHYYSLLFIRVLSQDRVRGREPDAGAQVQEHAGGAEPRPGRVREDAEVALAVGRGRAARLQLLRCRRVHDRRVLGRGLVPKLALTPS